MQAGGGICQCFMSPCVSLISVVKCSACQGLGGFGAGMCCFTLSVQEPLALVDRLP